MAKDISKKEVDDFLSKSIDEVANEAQAESKVAKKAEQATKKASVVPLKPERTESAKLVMYDNPGADSASAIKIKSQRAFTGNTVSNYDLLEIIAENQKKNKKQKFMRLWTGNGYYKNDEQNDYELVKELMFWTNHDFNKVDTMFRHSKLFSGYWNDPEYAERLLKKADKEVKNGYIGNEYSITPLKPEQYPQSMKQQFRILDYEREKFHLFYDQRNENHQVTKPAVMTSYQIGEILSAKVKLASPYLTEADKKRTLPHMYYDWDTGLYTNNPETINRMIARLERSISGDKARQKVVEDMVANDCFKPRQLTKATHPELVPCGNGIFDRKTKELLPYDPDKYCFTQKISTNYNSKATIEPVFGPNNWSLYKWLHDDVARGDEKMFTTIKQAILAAATGDTRNSKIALFYDDTQGSTGKSTLLKFIAQLVGPMNVGYVDFAASNVNNMLYQAYGAQVLIYDDPSKSRNNKIRHMGILKKIATNESIDLWAKYKDEFMAPMNAFLIIAINGQPHFSEANSAVASRLLPIKFTKQFDRNNSQDQKVASEYIKDPKLLEYVLNDLLNNVSLDAGFTMEKSIDSIMSESFSDYDAFSAFVEDVLSNWHIPYVPAQVMYITYSNFAVANHFGAKDIITVREFYKRIQQCGWTKKHGRIPKVYSELENHIINHLIDPDYENEPYTKHFAKLVNPWKEDPKTGTKKKATITVMDKYKEAFKEFDQDMYAYNIAAGRLAQSVYIYNTKASDPIDYSMFEDWQIRIPVTMLMINDKAKAYYDWLLKEAKLKGMK